MSDETVGLIYNLPGVNRTIISNRLTRNYRASAGKVLWVAPEDVDYLLSLFDKVRKINHFSLDGPEPDPEPVPEPDSEPDPEPDPEPVPEPDSETDSETDPEPDPEPVPEPVRKRRGRPRKNSTDEG